MTCICCSGLTLDHCRECSVPLCWPCGSAGLCGVCKRMEVYRNEHRLTWPAYALALVPLILTDEFNPWSANRAKKLASKTTEKELVKVKK